MLSMEPANLSVFSQFISVRFPRWGQHDVYSQWELAGSAASVSHEKVLAVVVPDANSCFRASH